MSRLIIRNARLILPDRIVSGYVLVLKEGKIMALQTESAWRKQPDDCVLDAGGNYVAPGFIDMHVHGGAGYDFMDGTVEAFTEIARIHAQHGTTLMVPTTLTGTHNELLQTFDTFRKVRDVDTKGAQLLGLHLEGPYFSPKQCGAQDPAYIRLPDPEEYMELINTYGDEIVRWSVAPELPGALEMGRVLKERNILASIAHSDAIYEEVVDAYGAGYTHITHLYSAMSTVSRRKAFRYAGIVEAAYLMDDMTVEIIADGVHLPKPLLQFVYRFKGPDRTALCTDAMRGTGLPDGESVLGSLDKGQKVIIEDGVAKLPDRSAFAGSVATTDRLVRTVVNLAGIPLVEAVRMMTLTPARILKVERQKGSIQVGKDADLVIFDEQIRIIHTIIKGHVIYSQ